MERQKVIDRVRKLFALSRENSNTHEMQSAMLMAQTLLLRHGIDGVEVAENEEGSDLVEDVAVITGLRRLDQWKRLLANTIADNFRCKVYTHRHRSTNENGCQIIDEMEVCFIGMSADMGIAREILNRAIAICEVFSTIYLMEQREKLNRSLSKSEAKKLSSTWKLGFVVGLNKAFKFQVEKNKWGLILQPSKKVMDLYDGIKATETSVSSPTAWDRTAYQDGMAHGNKFANANEKSVENTPRLLNGQKSRGA